MDNPNDFIHIDEVFKRLKDREEPEPAGAWMRMQDLLNEEMPVGAPAAGSMLRRYMIPLVTLLLIGSGVAYYNLKGSSDNNPNNTTFTSNNFSNNNSALKNNSGVNTNDLKTATDHSEIKGSNESTHAFASSDNNVKNSKSGNHHNLHSNNKQGSKAITVTSGNENKQTSKTNNIASTNNKHAKNNKDVVTHSAGNRNGKTGNTNTDLLTTDNGTASKAISQSNGNSNPVAMEQQNVVEQIYPGSSDNTLVSSAKNASPTGSGNNTGKKGAKRNHSNTSNTTVPGMNVVAANWNNNKIVTDQNGSYYKEVRDTFKKIDMLSHVVASNNNGAKTYVNKIDTLTITRVERIKFLPLAPMEMASLRQAKIIPQASVIAPIPVMKVKEYMVSNEMVNLVPLANYKVNSRKVDPSKFNQLMSNATQGISNYFDGTNKFYAAILLGGNTSLGNPSAFGMQLGIAGLYQLSERLTLDVEFKFANHYFSNYSINDQSVNFNNVSSQQVSGVEWLFNGTQTTTTSAYKINSFSELQLPVILNYSFGRLSVFGGVNMAYALPFKWNQTSSLSTQEVSSTQSQNSNPFLNQNATLDEKKDFDSRIGLGYVGGLSYDISRKISLDARVTQNLWSSYNGNADAINKLFKTPTFQFSIGYFFGRKERVVYIMDKR